MSDIGVAEIPVDEDERPLPPPRPPARNALLDGPILPTLLSLAWPNIMCKESGVRGRSSMVERQLPKLHTRVRFPSPAPNSITR